MQKFQVFKVKGMQRDASMPNANGEFAYEIINMRLMPAEDGAGFSLTNEKGTGPIKLREKGTDPIKLTAFKGSIIGQCATLDSLIVFTTDHGTDYIYQIKETETAGEWDMSTLYSGNLGFSEEYPIEALFNYETKDIQKVYWIDRINQLRCINIAAEAIANNDQQFDSIKQLNSLPNVDITRTTGGSFTAGVIQYYITYFNEFMTESPIVYTSPLLYIAHTNRGANTNDKVSTAFKISLSNLDRNNWEYIRIYATHRTSLDATPEASIISEIRITDAMSIDFIDYGYNRVSITPSDLYFTGGKPVKAGTMTVKDQVLFLGNLNLETSDQLNYKAIQKIFDDLRDIPDATYFRCDTRKSRNNDLKEYEETSYKYDNQLNNSVSITHYKYGEKYRFGISVMDKWGNWSNPIWIKDAFIEVPPEQTSINTLELPCPQLELDYIIPSGLYANKSLYDVLFTELGVKGIKPLVVFPSLDERKVLAQGVVCPTVYNLKDRKENGPYAQASWFMRPNAPINIWGTSRPSHNSDIINKEDDLSDGYRVFSKQSIENISIEASKWLDQKMSLVYDDLSIYQFDKNSVDPHGYVAAIKDNSGAPYNLYEGDGDFDYIAKDLISAGSWVEFRHNYALRTKGWTWGPYNDWYNWSIGIEDDNEWSHGIYPLLKEGKDIDGTRPASFIYRTWESNIDGNLPKDTTGMVAIDHNDISEAVANLNRIIFYKFRLGGARCAELDTSRFGATIPVNRFYDKDLDRKTWRGIDLIKFNTGNSAFYVDNSIVTFNSPEIEMNEAMVNVNLEGYDFRIVGMIPLTATVSDMSLETSGNLYNPSADADISLGFKKFVVRNKNIGHHGFKGMVTHSMFYSGHNHPGDTYTFNKSGSNLTEETNAIYHDRYVAAFPLHPWQSTGNIPGFLPDWSDKTNYSKIKRKILSNLRYSANTKFFSVGTLEELGTNKASLNLNGLSIGWKPMNGSNIQWYNATDSSIIKLKANGYQNDLVYSANIDSIALATAGENNDIPIRIYQYFYGRKLVPSAPLEFGEYSPYLAGASFDDVYKEGVGSSIKYKSSPHAVICFNGIPVSLDTNVQKYTQEILPAFDSINNEGRDLETITTTSSANAGVLYEDPSIISMPHQSVLPTDGWANYGLPGYNDADKTTNQPTYGWLWLGEIYKEVDPIFGGDSEYALHNNSWEVAGESRLGIPSTKIPGIVTYESGELETTYNVKYSNDSLQIVSNDTSRNAISFYIVDLVALYTIKYFILSDPRDKLDLYQDAVIDDNYTGVIREKACSFKLIKNGNSSKVDIIITLPTELGYHIDNVFIIGVPTDIFKERTLRWTQGDTYYQRFDTLKTYAYSDKDENSIVDITSFMVETRINIDGRTDRNRGQESNLQMSPSNFNLINDIYSQRDNFFTYRILDDDVQNRKTFPNQITWSLTKTAGATIDAWLNITLASVLDLDGTKGKLSALKTFNNNIIAFQDKGISTILFNSRVQIPTSEAVPIQIANSGKVEGQQYFTTDLGCQDKWNIVTSPQGLYFVDYYNKSIYKFNGQIEDLSTANGFRGWCDKNITSNSSIVGYYDKKNKEVIFYSDTFERINDMDTKWLGFSELTNAFSSFYTYPKARLISLQDDNLWLYNQSVYGHQTGKYNNLLGEESPYGLTVIVRNDSNITKIFNSIEFRSDLYENSDLRNFETFDTIQIEDEHNGKTSAYLDYSPYRPSNLKKRSRTWRAAIPRVGNGYSRYTNQWAKVGLWMTHKHNSMAVEHAEKTILHDMAVWYTE